MTKPSDEQLQQLLDREMPKLLAEMEQRLGSPDQLKDQLAAIGPVAPAQPILLRLPIQRAAAAAALLAVAGLLWWGLSHTGDDKQSRDDSDGGASHVALSHNDVEVVFESSLIVSRNGKAETFSISAEANRSPVKLLAGDTVTVGQGTAEVRFPDGSTASYSSGSHFVLDFGETGRPVFTLEEGSGSYSVQKQSTGLAVLTPIARVVVVGTEFSVLHERYAKRTGKPLTSVQVYEGEVQVSAASGNGRVSLVEGDQATVTARSVRLHARMSDGLSAAGSDRDSTSTEEALPTLFGDPAPEAESRGSDGTTLDLPSGQRR